MAAPLGRLRWTTMQSRRPHARSGWRPCESAPVLLAAPGLAVNAAEVAGNAALVRAANGGHTRRAYAPAGVPCTPRASPRASALQLASDCRDREQGPTSPRVAVISPRSKSTKLKVAGSGEPAPVPIKLTTELRCELQSLTCSPDPSSPRARASSQPHAARLELKKRAITASHRFHAHPRDPNHPACPISRRAAELSTRHGQRKHR